MKRILSVVLSAALLLNACASSEPQKTVLPDFLAPADLETAIDISIGFWNIQKMEEGAADDPLLESIQNLLHISIDPVSVTWADYKERYQMLSSTANLPDVFATLTISSVDTNDMFLYENMIQNGAISPLPEDLSKWPRLAALMEKYSYTKYRDGRYYAIPRISFEEPILGSTDACMVVRRDWMENLGISDPQTTDDFISMAAAFAADDPDGDGLNNTLGYNVNNLPALGKWLMLGIAPECNTYTWTEQDGRFVPSWSTDAFREVVTAYRRLYETGGLDPDFYTKKATDALEDFAAGRLGALEYKSSPSALMELEMKWNELNDKPFDECVDLLHIFPASDGICYSNSSRAFWSESFISSSVSDEKLERILYLFEYLLSDEGYSLCNYGIEGTDYQMNTDGSFSCLLALSGRNITEVLMNKYPSKALFGSLAAWGGGGSFEDFEQNKWNYLRFGKHCVDLAAQDIAWNQEHTTQLTRPYEFLMFPKEPSDLFGTSSVFDDFINIIIGTGDPLTMWDAALENYRQNGLDEYIECQNDAYQNR